MLPFTRDQFLAVFAAYNQAVWPAQVVAYVLGIGLVGLLMRPSRAGDRAIGAGLAAMWIWTGLAYYGAFFAAINKAALLFALLFVLQGGLILHATVVRNRVRFEPRGGAASWLGWALILYAAVAYPVVGAWTGHRYPEMPMFGITPCPVTLFTFGLLLLATGPIPRSLLVIPLIWSLIGGSAAFLLGMPQDWPLLVSGVAAVPLMLSDRTRRSAAALWRGGGHRSGAGHPRPR